MKSHFLPGPVFMGVLTDTLSSNEQDALQPNQPAAAREATPSRDVSASDHSADSWSSHKNWLP